MITFLRIIRFSFQDIIRNVWLSVATITILCLTLFSVNTLITVRVISASAVTVVKEKVNLSLYLNPDAKEEEILGLKARVANLDNVKSVQYISKQQALERFREKNISNPQVIQALRELGDNPLSPSLVISPANLEKTASLITALKRLDSDLIESRDFSDNAIILEKINYITNKVNQVGLLVISIFILTSLLVIYNTVKVAIYTHRKEIEIMRLVGASRPFIIAPYIVSAFVYSLISVLLIITVFFPFLSLLQPYLEVFFASYGVNILAYFIDNFWLVFGVQFLVLAAVNTLASLLAVRKYSRV